MTGFHDEPYELLEDGEATGMVELPVEWIRDDYVYFGMDRRASAQKRRQGPSSSAFKTDRPHMAPSAVLEIYEQEFEGAYDEGGLFLLTMHPHVSGHHSRIRMVDQFITKLRARDDIWFATHAEVAQYCLDNA